MALDIAIVAAALLGAFVGWRRGFLLPLMTVAGSLIGLAALSSGPAAGLAPTGTAGIGAGIGVVLVAGALVGLIGSALVSLVHRVGVLRLADQGLGVPLGAATGLIGVYVALAALVGFDAAIAPLRGAATVDAAAIAAVRAAVTANPQYAAVIDPAMLDQLALVVARTAIPRDQLAKAAEALAVYEEQVRPQLIGSALGPLVLSLGERLPIVGRHLEYPTK